MIDLLSNEHRITEKGMMEFQPFGIEADGTPIRDLSGVVIRADIDYLEDYVGRTGGKDAARAAVAELARRLNERIPDRAYHVTPEFLRNPWNSYSAEFSAFNAEFCIAISGDRDFLFNMARTKAISSIILALGRPFTVAQIYKMSAYFAQRYAKESFYTEAVHVLAESAVIRMRLSERTYRQFGRYRRACAEHWCNAHKGYFVAVPERFQALAPATVIDRRCLAKGDDYCEWEVIWSRKEQPGRAFESGARGGRLAGVEQESRRVTVTPRSVAPSSPGAAELFSRNHVITEKGMMEFQPFGVEPDRTAIRDINGMTIRACLEYLEACAVRGGGPPDGQRVIDELVRRLNERIPDRRYHITAEFLRNSWNSYSFEFVAFLCELCADISGDPQFSFNMAREKAITPFSQMLGRPFSIPRIYKMSPYFAQIYSGKNAYSIQALHVSDRSATVRMRFSERAYRQFGPYLRACAAQWCQAHQGYLVSVPEKFRHLPPAVITDRACLAKGDPYCEWEVVWSAKERAPWARSMVISLARRVLRKEIEEREQLIADQVQTLDARHVELQEAYVQQQQITAELQRRVEQLTMLHETTVVFASTLDREVLMDRVLETITQKLNYDRAMIAFFDPDRQVVYDTRLHGLPDDVADFARRMEVPVTDPDTLEGLIFLKGQAVIVEDVREYWDRMHPLYRTLATLTNAKSILAVPLQVKDRIIGSLTVDRLPDAPLTKEDLDLLITVGGQLAIALDKAAAHQQIEELNLSLEAKVRERTAALEEFLAKVSHDLRTPLTSITGFADNMLAGLVGPLTDKQQQYLVRMLANSRRLGRLVDNLLDMLLDREQVQLSPAECSLHALALDVVEQLRPLAASKQQRLEIECADEDLIVWADADKITRVLTNLVDNAIKYTPHGGEIAVKMVSEKGYVARLSVMDTGDGIPPEILPRIFDPSFHLDRMKAQYVKGHGLGLSIVRDLVERHGGTIAVESRVGKGSTFIVTLPLRRTIERKLDPSAEVKRILVADDDPDIRQMLTDRLTAEGYTVLTACDGKEALSALRAERLHGLILDIGMPLMSGLEVLDHIREEQPELPIIMVTAAEARERAMMAVRAGAQAYLLKPFDASELSQVIVQWVGPAR